MTHGTDLSFVYLSKSTAWQPEKNQLFGLFTHTSYGLTLYKLHKSTYRNLNSTGLYRLCEACKMVLWTNHNLYHNLYTCIICTKDIMI